jgi:beta propeller repeat protein
VTWNDATQHRPAISGNNIVWEDYRNGNADIYFYNTVQKQETQLVANLAEQVRPRISGNRVVWEDNRFGNWDVYVYGLQAKVETRLTTAATSQIRPQIEGDSVTWLSEGPAGTPGHPAPWCSANCGGDWLLYWYDLAAGMGTSVHTHLTHLQAVFRHELDGRFYGSSINYGMQDRAVGRIFGVTVSDVSAYIARDLFFEDLPKNRDALLVLLQDLNTPQASPCGNVKDPSTEGCTLEQYARTKFWTPKVRNTFDQEHFFAGANTGTAPVLPNAAQIDALYANQALVLYDDHGGADGFEVGLDTWLLRNNSTSMAPATVLDLACATGTVGWGYIPADGQFAMENIRRGAMVYMAAVDLSYWHTMFGEILTEAYVNKKTIGEAYLKARNAEYQQRVDNLTRELRGDPFYALVGDPTFRPRWW